MKFDYKGEEFRLEFTRKFKMITIYGRNGKLKMPTEKRSKYPFTIVRLLRFGGMSPTNLKLFSIVAEATVGCAPADNFSNREGRRQALRKLTSLVEDKELRRKIWQVYTDRGRHNG